MRKRDGKRRIKKKMKRSIERERERASESERVFQRCPQAKYEEAKTQFDQKMADFKSKGGEVAPIVRKSRPAPPPFLATATNVCGWEHFGTESRLVCVCVYIYIYICFIVCVCAPGLSVAFCVFVCGTTLLGSVPQTRSSK